MSFVALLFSSFLGFQPSGSAVCPLSLFCKSLPSFSDCFTLSAPTEAFLSGTMVSDWVSFSEAKLEATPDTLVHETTTNAPDAVEVFLTKYHQLNMLIEDLGIVSIDTAWRSGRDKLQLIVSPQDGHSIPMASITLTQAGDRWIGCWRATLRAGGLQEGDTLLQFSTAGSATGHLALEGEEKLVSIY